MTKNRILAVLLAGLICISLAGCTTTESELHETDNELSTVTTEGATSAIGTCDKVTEAETDELIDKSEESTSATERNTAEKEKSQTREPIKTKKPTEPTETTKVEPEETAPPETVKPQTTVTEPPADETTRTETTTPPKEETTEPLVQITEEPITTEQPVTSEPPKQTAEEPRGTEPTETTAPITELVPKSIYDAPFDIEQIRAELIAVGESMGMRHRTAYKDGTLITPDNSSWELPITANASFSGAVLKRSLHDYVSSYDEYELYGGEPITDFTIYVKQTADGYEFYFLH